MKPDDDVPRLGLLPGAEPPLSEEEENNWVEGMRLDTLIPLVSERTTHLSLDWADGVCRAEIRVGQNRYSARGPKASVAIGRAMLLFDRTNRRVPPLVVNEE